MDTEVPLGRVLWEFRPPLLSVQLRVLHLSLGEGCVLVSSPHHSWIPVLVTMKSHEPHGRKYTMNALRKVPSMKWALRGVI